TFAVFEIAFLVSDYFDENVVAKEVFITAFEDFLQAQYGGIYSDEELRDSAVYYADLFKNTEINLMQMVGLADGFVHHTRFDIFFAPDVSDTTP
ncbi:MAG TPA: hypothetical protein PLZ51_25810, partial [Aggregatilineales bacterium]|nr:hypothetical protein [Aggregatilineales bacterium]